MQNHNSALGIKLSDRFGLLSLIITYAKNNPPPPKKNLCAYMCISNAMFFARFTGRWANRYRDKWIWRRQGRGLYPHWKIEKYANDKYKQSCNSQKIKSAVNCGNYFFKQISSFHYIRDLNYVSAVLVLIWGNAILFLRMLSVVHVSFLIIWRCEGFKDGFDIKVGEWFHIYLFIYSIFMFPPKNSE